jgi:hypothetical protein
MEAVKNAESYTVEFHENGDMNFDGTPVSLISGVTYGQLPFIVPGFDGETTYSVRMKAVGAEISGIQMDQCNIYH